MVMNNGSIFDRPSARGAALDGSQSNSSVCMSRCGNGMSSSVVGFGVFCTTDVLVVVVGRILALHGLLSRTRDTAIAARPSSISHH
eukprot:3183102-Rhodomonas_salina.1